MKKLLFNILLILNIIFINCVSVEERTNQLNHAARYGQKDQVDQLIKDGAVLSKDTLNSAIISGNIEVVKFLLSKGLDINGSDRNKMDSLTYSFESPKSQKEEMFKFLLAEGAKMENPYNILYLGLRDMITPAVTAAIESGAYVDNSLVFEAGTPEHLEILLKNGANINAQNSSGYTLLHINIICCSPRPISSKFLIEKGINVNLKNNYGQTALHIAIKEVDRVKFLLEQKNIDINARDNDNATPLHYIWDADTAKILLSKKGINKNPIDKFGETPYQKVRREVLERETDRNKALLYTLKQAGCH